MPRERILAIQISGWLLMGLEKCFEGDVQEILSYVRLMSCAAWDWVFGGVTTRLVHTFDGATDERVIK